MGVRSNVPSLATPSGSIWETLLIFLRGYHDTFQYSKNLRHVLTSGSCHFTSEETNHDRGHDIQDKKLV